VVLHAKATPAGGPAPDRFSPEHTAALKAALQAQPEVRPEVVARARALAADPAYPSPEILRHVGATILQSPDPLDPAD
jgi:hypothetical protein